MIVEIGTSDFRTQAGKDNGLFIEPVKPYFDRLPECNRLNIAISNYTGSINVFYIDPEDIEKEGMPDWIRGCNSIGEPHPTVLKYGYASYVRSHTVEVKRIADVLKGNGISSISFLKIDTEGHDAVILNDYLDTVDFLPDIIQFENNVLSNEHEVNNLIFRLKKEYIIDIVKHDIVCKRIK